MITIGQEMHLGRRSFALLASRRMTLAYILFVASVAIMALNASLATGIAGLLSFGGPISGSAIRNISVVVSFIEGALLVGSIIAALLGFIVSSLQYKNYTFTMDEFGVRVRRGVLSQHKMSIPYRQIQDVDIVTTLSQRMFGVSKLVMITAGQDSPEDMHEQTDTVFDPIDQDLAEEVRSFLERKIGVQIVEGEGQADKTA